MTPPLTKLRMCDNYSSYTAGVDNFGPLFVKSMFSPDSIHVDCIDIDILYMCIQSSIIIRPGTI